jgi:molybdopterin converting factor subunit 1
MKVSVRLFAGLHDLVGRRELEMELEDGATVADLRRQLVSQYPAVAPLMNALVCAVDEEYVSDDRHLRPGDEVALIPPISGGASAGAERFRVTPEPLGPSAAAELVELVRRDESGAVALFYGVVRDHSHGRRVLRLEYDAYPSMAVKKMRQVAEEARSRWEITDMAISHRTGRLEVGETSLLVAVSAAHRREAFEACHYAVDRIKEIVPIWKKEVWEGGENWAEGRAVSLPDHSDSTRPARPSSRPARVTSGRAGAREKK